MHRHEPLHAIYMSIGRSLDQRRACDGRGIDIEPMSDQNFQGSQTARPRCYMTNRILPHPIYACPLRQEHLHCCHVVTRSRTIERLVQPQTHLLGWVTYVKDTAI